jgi:hypothetical protein
MASAIPIPCHSNRSHNAAPHGDTVAERFSVQAIVLSFKFSQIRRNQAAEGRSLP